MMSLVLSTTKSPQIKSPHSLLPFQPILYIPKRDLRQLYNSKKPKYRYKTDLGGKLILPESLPGYSFDQVEEFQKWLVRRTEILRKETGTSLGEKYRQEVNEQIRLYFNSVWGEKRTLISSLANKKRAKKRKIRWERLLWKYMDDWNALQDSKENKIIRDQIRDERDDRREQFSLKKFLAADRDRKRKPYVIEDEETFRNRLLKDKDLYLFRIPKSVRQFHRKRNPIGYRKRLEKEVIDPFVLELRRRARVSELVKEREDAIALVKYNQQIADRRNKRLEEKQEEYTKIRTHWNQVLGEWHKHNNTLLVMIREFQREREEIFTKSRIEYLKALQENVGLWKNNPNECRFIRFRFAAGVTFPYNKTVYQ